MDGLDDNVQLLNPATGVTESKGSQLMSARCALGIIRGLINDDYIINYPKRVLIFERLGLRHR